MSGKNKYSGPFLVIQGLYTHNVAYDIAYVQGLLYWKVISLPVGIRGVQLMQNRLLPTSCARLDDLFTLKINYRCSYLIRTNMSE